MPPKIVDTKIQYPVQEPGAEVLCPITQPDGTRCRKRCLGVSYPANPPARSPWLDNTDAYSGETISLNTGAYPSSTPRILPATPTSHERKFRSDGQYPTA